MTLEELIEKFRERTGDDTVPYRTSDAECTDYLNDGQNEACRRARLIMDSTTPEICQITLAAGEATYALDSRVLVIRRAKLSGRSLALVRKSHKDLDRQAPDWQDETGEPRAYVPDMDDRSFRPYPTPEEAGTVTLTVARLPLDPMEQAQDEPEIRVHLHEALLDWAMHRHFSKPDPDIHDEKRATYHEARFEREFGAKSSAIDEQWQHTHYGYTDDEGEF